MTKPVDLPLPPTVLFVDADAHWLQQFSAWKAPGCCQILTAASGHGALILMKRHDVAVVVLDLQLPDLPGQSVLNALHDGWPEVPIIIHTGQVSVDIVFHALRRGKAFDLLRKPLAAPQALHDTIVAALRARSSKPSPRHQGGYPDLALTDRERQLIACLSEGFSNLAIAEALSLSEKTVRNRLSCIYAKLGVASRTELLVHLRQIQANPISRG